MLDNLIGAPLLLHPLKQSFWPVHVLRIRFGIITQILHVLCQCLSVKILTDIILLILKNRLFLTETVPDFLQFPYVFPGLFPEVQRHSTYV